MCSCVPCFLGTIPLCHLSDQCLPGQQTWRLIIWLHILIHLIAGLLYLQYTWLPQDVNSFVTNNGSRVNFQHVPTWTQQKEIRANRQGSLRLYYVLAWDIKELCLFSLTCLTPIVSSEEIRMWWKAYKEGFESKIVYIAKVFGARLSGSCRNYSTWDAETVYRLPRQTRLHGHTLSQKQNI